MSPWKTRDRDLHCASWSALRAKITFFLPVLLPCIFASCSIGHKVPKNPKKLEDMHLPMAICNCQVPKVQIAALPRVWIAALRRQTHSPETYNQSSADRPIKVSSNAIFIHIQDLMFIYIRRLQLISGNSFSQRLVQITIWAPALVVLRQHWRLSCCCHCGHWTNAGPWAARWLAHPCQQRR